MVIIDAWMRHPSAEFLADPVFDSLRRRARGRLAGGEVPVAATVAAGRIFGLAAGPGPASPATTERARA